MCQNVIMQTTLYMNLKKKPEKIYESGKKKQKPHIKLWYAGLRLIQHLGGIKVRRNLKAVIKPSPNDLKYIVTSNPLSWVYTDI